MRIGKRTLNAPDVYSSLRSQAQLPTEPTEDTTLDANNMNTDILAF